MSEQETPPVPATGTPGTPPATGTPSTGAKPSVEELQVRIAELERHSTNKTEEASRHGKNLSEAQKKLAEYEEKERLAQEATLSEIEKSKKVVEAEKAARAAVEAQIQQLKQELVSKMVQLMAKEKGIIDSELASLAIQGKLELGEDGMPTNVDKALDDLIKNKPYLAPKPAEPTQEQPPDPTQTANNQRPPATPAMNPGRSSISAPATSGRIPRLSDPGVFVAPGTPSKYQP
jgi:hypothetical protein